MSALPELTVKMTVEDVGFVRAAQKHYRVFAEAAEENGDTKTAGVLRAQEFCAERLYARILEAPELPEDVRRQLEPTP